MEPWAPRHTCVTGLDRLDDWSVRRWRIVKDGPFDAARFAAGVALAHSALPRPARAPGRPGLAFLIEHQGNGDYVVLGWWDRENELPLRVFVRAGAAWRPAEGSESICVWDLEVLARERAAYVRTILGPEGADPDAWMRDPAA